MLVYKKSPLLVFLILAACATTVSSENAQKAESLTAQGKTLLSVKKSAEARDVYLDAIAHNDQNVRAWNGLGVAYDLLGSRDKAQDAYSRAVDLAPEDFSAVNNLAHLYLEKGDAAEAVRLLTPLAQNPAAPTTVRQNLAAATKAAQVKETASGEVYADLGASPTEAMAQGHLAEAKTLLGKEAAALTFRIISETKVSGGTPVFTARIFGEDPQLLCGVLNPQAIPCIPHGKR